MQRRYILSLTGVLIFFITALSFGQEEPKDQLFSVHQDNIKPSMVGQYEEAAMGLIAWDGNTHNVRFPN